MRTTAVRNVSAIALLAALVIVPSTAAQAQSANASDRGQEMGQGTPGGSNPNAGPGNNSGQGNQTPGATGAAMSGNPNAGPGNNSSNAAPGSTGQAMSGNANAGPGNNSGDGSTTPATGTSQTPGPDHGHNCGGQGHIDNDAPGHQHDDCEATGGASMGGGSTGTAQPMPAQANAGGAAVVNRANGAPMAGQVPAANAAANAGGAAGQFATADCSLTEGLTPIFGPLTQQEVQVLATADEAALIPVDCPEISINSEAQQAVASNPGIVRALEAQGYSVQQVISAEVSEPPVIYVEAPSTN